MNVEINGEVKGSIKEGQGFGELALLYSAPRSASIKAVTSCYLWFIDRKTFRSAVESMTEKSFKENRKYIEQNRFFGKFLDNLEFLTSNQKDKIASICICQRYEKGTLIVREGDLASSMFIVKSGKLTKVRTGIETSTVREG